jgi:hypothetical protein
VSAYRTAAAPKQRDPIAEARARKRWERERVRRRESARRKVWRTWKPRIVGTLGVVVCTTMGHLVAYAHGGADELHHFSLGVVTVGTVVLTALTVGYIVFHAERS